MSKLTGIVVEPGKDPEVREIARSIESYQEIVGGPIQILPSILVPRGVVVYCNEEGKYLGLEPTMRLRDLQLLVGPVLILGEAGAKERSLTLVEVDAALTWVEEGQAAL